MIKKINIQKGKKAFTLIELITAMAIFSVLMVIMMKFFNEAQKAWTMSAERAEIYDNGRIAMGLIAKDLQSAVYTQDQTPFWHCNLSSGETDTGTKEMFAFVSATSLRPNSYCSPSCEIKYKLFYAENNNDPAGWLMRSTTGDFNDDNSDNVYNASTNATGRWNYVSNFSVGKTGVTNVFTRNNDSGGDKTATYDSGDFVKIIPYVTSLRFDCYDKNNGYLAPDTAGSSGDISQTTGGTFPSMVKITLKLLDKNSWNKWIAMGATPNQALDDSDATADPNDFDPADFRKSKERTFTKIVFLKNKTD